MEGFQGVLSNRNIDRVRGSFGFTLIELMIAIAIVGTLASIGIPKAWDHMQRRALDVEMLTIVKQIERIRLVEEKTLIEITGHSCSSCSCRASIGNACINDAKAVFTKINFPDGWKSRVFDAPFMIDENEGESYWQDQGANCVLDSIAVCDLQNQVAYVAFVDGFTCMGASQFDVEDDEGEALEDISTLFTCQEI